VRLLPVTLGVTTLALALWAAVVAGLAPLEVSPLWITALLLCGFVVADLSEVHVEVRRHTVSLSLSEVPLVLGLFLVDPLSLLAARLLGTVVMEFWRRSAPDKASFNLALFSAEVAAAVLLFSAVAGGAGAGPRTWVAAYVATLGAALLTGALVCLAIVRMQGPLARNDVVLMLAPLVVGSQLSTTFVLVALVTVDAEARAVALLAVLLLLSIGGYRGYSTLLRRHRSLAQMRDFTAAMSAGGTAEELAAQALRHARGLLSATHGVLALDGSGRRPPSTLAQRGDVEERLPEPPADAVTRRVRTSGAGLVVPRGSRDPAASRWLHEQGVRDAVVVPLLSTKGVVGTLQVGQRLGETGTFGDADRQLLQMVAVHLEIALRSGDLLEELRYEATHDSLTGLPNRALFQERVTTAVTGHRGRGAFAVLLLDLDGFKDVNDTLGHRAGDMLLRDVAHRLVRAVPAALTAARLGGDEFALLVQVGEDPAEVEAVAAEVQRSLREPMVIDALELEVRASIGVARFPEHGTDGALLLRRADIAMYAAKEARLPVLVYEPEIDRSSPRRLAMISELRAAIESGQLVCHYQPKVALDGRTVLGVEALVRWSHPRLGLVAPDDFVPIAERTGLIVPMTAFVLESALRDCARWRAEGRDLGVAVNVSPRGLLAPHFVAEVASLLEQTGVPACALTLEITESSIMSDPVTALAVLAELHQVGVQLSIDDFGTGYSSLAYLQRLPVHEVKIDKSFVLDLATDDSNVAIVRAIVDLAHNLGLRVVAEGVEDQRSLVILRQLGCHAVQGYLVSRPLPAGILESWLSRPDGPAPGPGGVAAALVRPRLIALP
jgi:diguanylate cyclase (GGDEF)-like protein